MILFTLRCASGHEFEAWFRDGEGFETQQSAGEIACPHCETKNRLGWKLCQRCGEPLPQEAPITEPGGAAATALMMWSVEPT